MKELWICQWESIPGDGEHKQPFSTLAEAKQAMREKIASLIDLKAYLGVLDPRAADFLEKYLSDPRFPQSESDIPKEYEDPEYGFLFLSAQSIHWDYPCAAYPRINGNLVLNEATDGDYAFNFWYEYPEEVPSNGTKELCIRIYPQIDYGTSAYPLMVLLALREDPMTQEQIIRTISDYWKTDIERKAIGRHLQLLQDMGFSVQKCADGYCRGGKPHDPKPGIKYSPSAYPLMILKVLDNTPKTQAKIIQNIQEKYGVKIGRKAVSRHLDLLEEMYSPIRHDQKGYCIIKKGMS